MTREELINKIIHFEEEMSRSPANQTNPILYSPLLGVINLFRRGRIKGKMKALYEEINMDLELMKNNLDPKELQGLKKRIDAAYKS